MAILYKRQEYEYKWLQWPKCLIISNTAYYTCTQADMHKQLSVLSMVKWYHQTPFRDPKHFWITEKFWVHTLPQVPLLHLTPPFLSNIFAWTISNIKRICSLPQGASVSGTSMLMVALNRLIEVRGTHTMHTTCAPR